MHTYARMCSGTDMKARGQLVNVAFLCPLLSFWGGCRLVTSLVASAFPPSYHLTGLKSMFNVPKVTQSPCMTQVIKRRRQRT